MMSRVGDILEEHVEKIVLGISGIICLLILIFLLNPNSVEYDRENFGATEIDSYISKQAEELSDKLDQPPLEPEQYIPRSNEYTALVESAIRHIDTHVSPPIPPLILRDIRIDSRRFRIPRLTSEVNDVTLDYIRAVAYVPTEEINKKNTYKQATHEPNDIDFVTVEAKFDAAGLYERFYESFAGTNVQENWRDPCLAIPVFAAVELQRQQLLKDGKWSDWQTVPRTKIDADRELFKIIEKVGDLPPGGITVRMLQFDNPEIQINLLQPKAYTIASANEEWFPPSLHKKFVELRRAEESEAKRQAIENAREERERERQEQMQDRRTGRTDTRRSGTTGLYGTRGSSSSSGRYQQGTRMRGGIRSRTDRRGRTNNRRFSRTDQSNNRNTDRISTGTRREAQTEETSADIYDEFTNILITPETKLSNMSEPMVFWAHDDTIKPENSYQYRMRIGVFNPVAGTGQFDEQDIMWRDKVILWSEFSDVTDTVDIPGKLYFFASDIQVAAKTVTVEVFKYMLGYWYNERFAVKRGEVIGKIKSVELEPEELEKGLTVPDIIDYGTGALLVDVVPANDWAGINKLSARDYYEMLYSFDGINMEHMPVKSRYWAKDMQATFGDIQRWQRVSKEPLRPWGSRTASRRRRITEPEFLEDDLYYDFGDGY